MRVQHLTHSSRVTTFAIVMSDQEFSSCPMCKLDRVRYGAALRLLSRTVIQPRVHNHPSDRTTIHGGDFNAGRKLRACSCFAMGAASSTADSYGTQKELLRST
jgi:hypothetical protein